MELVELSINNHIVDVNSQTPYYKSNIAQARPMSVSDVLRSLQSWVSTTHRSYSQLTFFNVFIKYIYLCCGVGWRFRSSRAQIECSNESSGQHTASVGASHTRRATGLAETAGAGRWVSSESVPTENPRSFHYLQQGDLQEKFPRFNMRIAAVLLYQ